MSAPERVRLDEIPPIPDMTVADNGAAASEPGRVIQLEDWKTFLDNADATIPCVVDRLWPEGALGFISSPPKKGKTWLALSLALSIVTGQPFLGQFRTPAARPVLYVALEGHRAAIADRISVLARGMGLDPDEQIPGLHLAYKPRGLNISDPAWAAILIEQAHRVGAAMMIVDVLRAAAILKENAPEDFGKLRDNLAPLAPTCAAALLHHFTKLSEISKERDPGERMSGSGAMFGALDVGVYITGSQEGARRLRLEFDCRDIATPGTVGVYLEGHTTGENDGFARSDKAWWIASVAPDEDDVDVPAEEILEWLFQQEEPVTKTQIAAAFEIAERTVNRRVPRLAQLGATIERRPGKQTLYSYRGPQDEQLQIVQHDVRHEGVTEVGQPPVTQAVSHPDPHEHRDPRLDTPPVTRPPVTAQVDNKKSPYAGKTPSDQRRDTRDFPYGEVATADAAHVPEQPPEPHDDDLDFTTPSDDLEFPT